MTKVRVLTSSHSGVRAGMEGEAEPCPDLGGYQVTFKDFSVECATVKTKKQDTTVFFTKDQLEFL